MLLNYTPGTIRIATIEGLVVEIDPSGEAKCSSDTKRVDVLDFENHKIEVVATTWGEVEGLPDPQEGTEYIVTNEVAELLKGQRSDLYITGGKGSVGFNRGIVQRLIKV